MLPAVTVRQARPEEASALTALCVRSKAHWGYDAEFMALSQVALSIDPAAVAEGRVFVATDASDLPLGVAACVVRDGGAELTHLFVAPDAFGRGAGAALFAEALAWTRRQGHDTLLIASDPDAAGFYERMGAMCVGRAPSEAIPGRYLPLYACSVTKRRG